MTTHKFDIVLLAALLVTAVACAQSVPAPPRATAAGSPVPDISIPLVFSSNGTSCVGALDTATTNPYSRKIHRDRFIQWTIRNANCMNFDATKACVDFSNGDRLLVQGPHQCGDMPNSVSIDKRITNSKSQAPDNSTHIYSIRYNNVAGGDPEIEVVCDTCSDR